MRHRATGCGLTSVGNNLRMSLRGPQGRGNLNMKI